MSEKSLAEQVLDLQLQRTIGSYPDFLQQKGFDQLPGFFEKLYAPNNRKAQVEVVKKLREKVVSVSDSRISKNMDNLILLSEITEWIDHKILEAVETRIEQGKTLSIEVIEEAMYEVGFPEVRREQILMVSDSLDFFHKVTNMTFIKILISPIKLLCGVFGAHYLVEIIDTGFAVSRHIKDIEPFTRAFREREVEYLKTVYRDTDFETIKFNADDFAHIEVK